MDESFLIGVRSLHAADIESYDSPNMIVSSLAHANVVSSIQIASLLTHQTPPISR